MLTGLPPVCNARTRILVLGSFPGQASLAVQQYYAHPRNQFWRLLGDILHLPLVDWPYTERLTAVLNAGVGIWDIYAQCERQGSLDSAIRRGVRNNVIEWLRAYPLIRRIVHNGQMAGRWAPHWQTAGYQTLILPSSSPAHARMRYDDKLALWRIALT